MARKVNKVELGGEAIIDLTSDTVDAEHLADGYTAHDASGEVITGSMQIGKNVQTDWDETDTESPAFLKNKPFGATSITISYDGSDTGETIDLGEGIILHKLPYEPFAINAKTVRLRVSTPEGEEETAAVVYSSPPLYGIMVESIPLFYIFAEEYEGIQAGIYAFDFETLKQEAGVEIKGVSFSVENVKKIDEKFLPDFLPAENPTGSGTFTWNGDAIFRGTVRAITEEPPRAQDDLTPKSYVDGKIQYTSKDPGEGSDLATGTLLVVYY